MLKLVKKSRCNLVLKFGSAGLSLAFPALQQQRSICPQAQEGAAQLWGQEHPLPRVLGHTGWILPMLHFSLLSCPMEIPNKGHRGSH